jgi:hypothetical protein
MEMMGQEGDPSLGEYQPTIVPHAGTDQLQEVTWHLEQAALIMGSVPVQGAEEAEAAHEGCMLLEVVINNVQDKVQADEVGVVEVLKA